MVYDYVHQCLECHQQLYDFVKTNFCNLHSISHVSALAILTLQSNNTVLCCLWYNSEIVSAQYWWRWWELRTSQETCKIKSHQLSYLPWRRHRVVRFAIYDSRRAKIVYNPSSSNGPRGFTMGIPLVPFSAAGGVKFNQTSMILSHE